MDFKGIEPFVRHIEKIAETREAGASLVSYDHILLYVISGEVELEINAKPYSAGTNSLIFIQGGIPYQIKGWKNAVCIRMHFDFKADHRIDCPMYIRPVVPEAFEPSKLVEREELPVIGLNEVFYLEDVYELEHFFQYILLEEKQQDKYYDIIGSALVRIILAYAGRSLDWKRQENKAAKHDVVDDMISFLNRNVDREISNELIGRTFGFHPKYINTLFEKETGYSIHKYVRMKRISQAMEYIQTTELPICEIAERLGFTDVKYFAKVFKKMVGKTPQEYRKFVKAAHN